MKIWRLFDPNDYSYAIALLRGTWKPQSELRTCSDCGNSNQARIQPLLIEWQPGSDKVGDFTWPGFCQDVAVTQRLVNALGERFRGFEPGVLQMIQDHKLCKPQRITKRTKPRIWLPYEGPPLYDLWITAWVHLDLQKSSLERISKCQTCGYEKYEVEGIEIRRKEWDPDRKELKDIHIPRIAGQGLFIPANNLRGIDIFRTYECPGWILCTDTVKAFIEREKFTNVTFSEYGDTS